jgi:hypothetical protein
MFTLPLFDYILKRGEDERGVENGMTSFTNFESYFFCVGVSVGVGVAFAWAWAWRSRGLSPLLVMFMQRVNISRAHAEVRVLWLKRLLVGNVTLCRGWNRQA